MRTVIVMISSVAVVVAVVMLANVGAGSAGLQVSPPQPTPLVGTAIVTTASVPPMLVGSASTHGFTVLAKP
jgi:hypothetical protein